MRPLLGTDHVPAPMNRICEDVRSWTLDKLRDTNDAAVAAPDREATLNRLAAETGRTADQVALDPRVARVYNRL